VQTVELCCGQRPLEQVSHGRHVRFCIRCGARSDAGGAVLSQRMLDEAVKFEVEGEQRAPAIMMRDHEHVRGIRRKP